MPAKKKKDKKGDKKAKDGPVAPQKSLEELDKPISDTTKEFYLVQVRDLEDKLERYKDKCDALQAKYDGLSKSHSQSIKDRDDIIALLKKDLQTESDRYALQLKTTPCMAGTLLLILQPGEGCLTSMGWVGGGCVYKIATCGWIHMQSMWYGNLQWPGCNDSLSGVAMQCPPAPSSVAGCRTLRNR